MYSICLHTSTKFNKTSNKILWKHGTRAVQKKCNKTLTQHNKTSLVTKNQWHSKLLRSA